MGFFDNARFDAPNVNAVVPSLEHFTNYKDSERRKQFEFEKELQNFKAQQRMRDFSQTMDMENIARQRQPLNVAPPTGLITPLAQEQMNVERDRTRTIADNNALRNQIALMNATTRKELGEEGLDVKREIADKTLGTRSTIADKTIQSRENIADKNIQGRIDLENTRQPNRLEVIGARGEQTLANTAARGAEDRLTKQVPSPNTRANDPSQQGIAEKQRANEFINRNPELGQWIKFDPNTGMVSITPPSNNTSLFGGAKGPSVPEYHRILAGVYGSGTPTPNQPATATPAVTPPVNSDRVRVQLPDGRIGYLPRSQANQPGIKILGGG